MKFRVILIDDEPPARKKLRYFLKKDPRIEIVGEADNGLAAIRLIEELRPDLVFLDIQMPHMNGFEVLQELRSHRPQVIFTTAYDQYAVRAFEVRALDYLLKPFDEQRFQEALARVFQNKNTRKEVDEKIEDLLGELQSKQSFLRRILMRSEGRIFFIKTDQIHWIEAEEKYVRIHTGKESYLHRETMNALEAKLDPDRFVRIHRSQIVNMDRIKELQAWSHGDYMVVLTDETKLPLGRAYREKFLRAFEFRR